MRLDLETTTWPFIEALAYHLGLTVILSKLQPDEQEKLWDIYRRFEIEYDKPDLRRICPRTWADYKLGKIAPVRYDPPPSAEELPGVLEEYQSKPYFSADA